MATQAFSAYGSQVRMGDGAVVGSAAISAASGTAPIIITTAVPHGILDISYGTITGATGMTSLNGSWILERLNTTQVTLRNSFPNSPYLGGGILTVVSTFAYIVELTNVQDAGSRTDLIDTSAHDGNGYSSQVATLKRTNQMRLDVNLVPGNPTHDELTGLLSLYGSSAYRHWLLVLPPYPVTGRRSVGHVYGGVVYYTESLPVAGIVAAQFTLAFDGPFEWSD